MNFHWKRGCLRADDFQTLVAAIYTIQNGIHYPHLGGFTDSDGTDYYTVDWIAEPNDFANAVSILLDFTSRNKTSD